MGVDRHCIGLYGVYPGEYSGQLLAYRAVIWQKASYNRGPRMAAHRQRYFLYGSAISIVDNFIFFALQLLALISNHNK